MSAPVVLGACAWCCIDQYLGTGMSDNMAMCKISSCAAKRDSDFHCPFLGEWCVCVCVWFVDIQCAPNFEVNI